MIAFFKHDFPTPESRPHKMIAFSLPGAPAIAGFCNHFALWPALQDFGFAIILFTGLSKFQLGKGLMPSARNKQEFCEVNTAQNMRPISLDDFRRKRKKEEKAYTDGARLLSMKEVTEKVGVHRSSINRWVEAGMFPPKFHLGTRVFWFESEIDEYLLQQRGDNRAQ